MYKTTEMTADQIDQTAPVMDDNEQPDQEKTEPNLSAMIVILEKQMAEVRRAVTDILSGMKVVKKQAAIISKQAERKKSKKNRSVQESDSTKASGFAAPSVLSADLKKFMGIGPLDKRSRTEVTKWLCQFVEENNLQGEGDKRYISFDRNEAGKRLKDLLRVSSKESITYFDLQHYLKFHISSKANPITFEDSVFDDGSFAPNELSEMINNAHEHEKKKRSEEEQKSIEKNQRRNEREAKAADRLEKDTKKLNPEDQQSESSSKKKKKREIVQNDSVVLSDDIDRSISHKVASDDLTRKSAVRPSRPTVAQ